MKPFDALLEVDPVEKELYIVESVSTLYWAIKSGKQVPEAFAGHVDALLDSRRYGKGKVPPLAALSCLNSILDRLQRIDEYCRGEQARRFYKDKVGGLGAVVFGLAAIERNLMGFEALPYTLEELAGWVAAKLHALGKSVDREPQALVAHTAELLPVLAVDLLDAWQRLAKLA